MTQFGGAAADFSFARFEPDSVPIAYQSSLPVDYGAAGLSSPTRPGSLPVDYGAASLSSPTRPGQFREAEPVYSAIPVHTAPPAEFAKSSTRMETLAPFMCELLGTFVLTFTTATCNYADFFREWSATAIGCAVVVITSAVGFVSGGHLNPAVSLAALLAQKISGFTFAVYVVVQFFGGLIAGLCFEVAFLTHASSVMPAPPFHFAPAATVELLFTAMICFVWLSVVGSVRNNPESDRNQFFALAIGAAYTAAGYAGGRISGALFNPALALGLDLAGWWRGGFLYGFLYVFVELVGAVIAVLLFRVCRKEDYLPVDIASYVPSLAVRTFAEFVGTFFLVLTFGLSTILLNAATAWAAAAALLCLTYSLSSVSGGHLNPAVTLAVVLGRRGRCAPRDGACYALAQLLAGLVAGALMLYVHACGPTAREQFGLAGLTGDYPWGASVTLEIMFTFFLAHVVLSVATVEEYTVPTAGSRPNSYFAVAIGFAMCAGSFASGRVSGGYMNPAVALGFAAEAIPNLWTQAKVAHWFWLAEWFLRVASFVFKVFVYFLPWVGYLFYELIGGALAAAVFRVSHPAEFEVKMLPLGGGAAPAEHRVRSAWRF